MKCAYSLVVAFLFSVFVDAQTITAVNGAGATVVEVVTTNALGLPNTQILQTIGAGGAATTSQTLSTAVPTTTGRRGQTTVSTTTTQGQVGPVGQPGTTPVTPGGPTPYDYTTVDANGQTVVLQGVFTPTGPATVLPPQTTTGTVLNYSQYLSLIGTNTAPASAAGLTAPVAAGWYYLAATTLAGLVGGAWLIVF